MNGVIPTVEWQLTKPQKATRMMKSNSRKSWSVVISSGRKSLLESEVDPDFDPEVISTMSPILRAKLKKDPFSHHDDGAPLVRYSPSRGRACRLFLRKLFCSCRRTRNSTYESSSNADSSDPVIYPYQAARQASGTTDVQTKIILEKFHKGNLSS